MQSTAGRNIGGGYQKIIIVKTASRLMPTARSPTIMASSISMRRSESQSGPLRVVNLQSVLRRTLV